MDKYLDEIFNDIDSNIKLDKEQKDVVLDNSNHLIVVAGAGSGKTLTISAKIKYLVDIMKIKPDQILVISLTNKAIEELKERINIKLKIPVKICTFHKLGYEIIKKNDKRYRINSNSNIIVKEIIQKRKNNNRIIKYLRRDKIYKKIDNNSLSSLNVLIDLTSEIIKMIKTLDIDVDNIKTNSKITNDYLYYLKSIYKDYNDILRQNNELDFEDLILEATKLDKIECNYKYILVDEYQDISNNRYNLLKKLVEKTKAKTIVVGDDFQAIFSFAGSDVNLFLNYQSEMNARLLKLTHTYRNSHQLIDVAGNFVMKDKSLIIKNLDSQKDLNKPVKIYGYKENITDRFEEIIIEIINKYGINKNILVLGRYNSDYYKIKGINFIFKEDRIIYKKNKIIEIKFMTIHSSKGLGYDNVILLNFTNDYMGFPSNIKDNIIKKNILNIEDNLNEERRLFYVALTRTKNEIYILTQINNESIFMKDIYNNPNVYIDYNFKLLKRTYKHKIK